MSLALYYETKQHNNFTNKYILTTSKKIMNNFLKRLKIDNQF